MKSGSAVSTSIPAGLSGRLLTAPPRHPVIALIIAAILAGLSIFGILRIHFDSSLESLFAKNDPSAMALTRVLDRFSAADDLLILVSLPEKSGATTDPGQLLSFAARLNDAIQHSPQASSLCDAVIYRTDDQTRVFFEKVLVPNGLYYLDAEEYEAAKNRLTRPEMAKQIHQDEAMISAPAPPEDALAKAIMQDPLRLHEFILNRLSAERPMQTYQNGDALISPDGRNLLIRVSGKRPPSDLAFCKEFTVTITGLADHVNSDHLEIDFSGAYAIAAASERAIRHDMIWSIIGSVVCLQVLFMLAYRRPFRLFALAFGPVALGILYGMGAYGMIWAKLTPMTAVIGGVLAGMGIDYSIQHLALYYTARQAGLDPLQSATRTITTLWPALLAAWATSIVGFLVIGWSSVQALRDFSLLGTLGLTGAFLGSVGILQPLLALTDRQPLRPRFSITPLLQFVSRWRLPCLSICGAIFAAALIIIALPGEILPLEADQKVMHPRPNPPLDAEAKIAQRMGIAPGSLIIDLQADSPEHLVSLAHQVDQRLDTPAAHAAGVMKTYGLASLLPDPQVAKERREALGPDQADRIITDFRSVIADSLFDAKAFEPYILFLKTLLTPRPAPGIADLLPYRRLAETMLPRSAFTPGASEPTESITLVFLNHPTEDRPARDSAVNAIRGALADLPTATLTGLSVISHDTEETIHHDLPRLLLAAMAVVAIYLVVQFRTLIDPLLALVPTIFSLVCLLAVMRLTGQKLNMVNLVCLPLLIGIDVDYGIFLVSVARHRAGDKSTGSIDLTDRMASSGHAVIMCAAATILGFGSLAFTSVPAIQSLGIAVGVGVGACLVGAVFILLPILTSVNPQSKE